MSSLNIERAALLDYNGASRRTESVVACAQVAGGYALPTSALAGRVGLIVSVPPAETDYLYVSIGGTPVATDVGEWSLVLTGGDSVWIPVGAGVTVKAIADAGTIQAHVCELAGVA